MDDRLIPPAPRSEPRRPGLRSAGALPRRIEIRDIVVAWAERRRVSRRDMVAVLGVNRSRVDRFLDGHDPFPVEALLALRDGGARRDAMELWNAIASAVERTSSAA